VTYEPHSAVTGLAFAGALGRAYRGNVFIAHWGTYVGRRHGRYVSRTRLTPRGPVVTRFVTGLEHPIATAFEPGGALLVADYGTGASGASRAGAAESRSVTPARPAFGNCVGGRPTGRGVPGERQSPERVVHARHAHRVP
jgi:glucose/arabinose dehydrogenase